MVFIIKSDFSIPSSFTISDTLQSTLTAFSYSLIPLIFAPVCETDVIALIVAFVSVFIIDSTYKTHAFSNQLVHIELGLSLP